MTHVDTFADNKSEIVWLAGNPAGAGKQSLKGSAGGPVSPVSRCRLLTAEHHDIQAALGV
jgi:hypothetical protein